MNVKKQQRGNCQCCGKQQAVLASGVMSKHGYTVDNGWFNGVCDGQNYEPMQVSREVSDKIADQILAECVELEKKAVAYKEGRAHPKMIKLAVYARNANPMVSWDEADEYKQAHGLQVAIFALESRARMGRSFVKSLFGVADKAHGQPLIDVVVPVAAPAILIGEKRISNGKILLVVSVRGGRVYWKNERGFGSWTGTQAWRKLEQV